MVLSTYYLPDFKQKKYSIFFFAIMYNVYRLHKYYKFSKKMAKYPDREEYYITKYGMKL